MKRRDLFKIAGSAAVSALLFPNSLLNADEPEEGDQIRGFRLEKKVANTSSLESLFAEQDEKKKPLERFTKPDVQELTAISNAIHPPSILIVYEITQQTVSYPAKGKNKKEELKCSNTIENRYMTTCQLLGKEGFFLTDHFTRRCCRKNYSYANLTVRTETLFYDPSTGMVRRPEMLAYSYLSPDIALGKISNVTADIPALKLSSHSPRDKDWPIWLQYNLPKRLEIEEFIKSGVIERNPPCGEEEDIEDDDAKLSSVGPLLMAWGEALVNPRVAEEKGYFFIRGGESAHNLGGTAVFDRHGKLMGIVSKINDCEYLEMLTCKQFGAPIAIEANSPERIRKFLKQYINACKK